MELGLSNEEESFFDIPPKIFFPVLSNLAIPNIDDVGIVDVDVIKEKDVAQVVDVTCVCEVIGLQIFKFSDIEIFCLSIIDFCISLDEI